MESLGPGREPEEVDPAFERRWQKFVDDLELGVTQMQDYVTRQPFASPFVHQSLDEHIYRDEKAFRSAAEVYRQFRLMVQVRWFEQECERYGRADRRTEHAAWLLLMLSAGAAFGRGRAALGPCPRGEPLPGPRLSGGGHRHDGAQRWLPGLP